MILTIREFDVANQKSSRESREEEEQRDRVQRRFRRNEVLFSGNCKEK